MNPIDYNNDINEDLLEDNYQSRDMNSPDYSMYYCPLCNYSMPMRDEYYNSDEFYDPDQYDDSGYRQRRRRRRRRRRRYPRPYFYPFYPFYSYYNPYFNYGHAAPFLTGLVLGSFF